MIQPSCNGRTYAIRVIHSILHMQPSLFGGGIIWIISSFNFFIPNIFRAFIIGCSQCWAYVLLYHPPPSTLPFKSMVEGLRYAIKLFTHTPLSHSYLSRRTLSSWKCPPPISSRCWWAELCQSPSLRPLIAQLRNIFILYNLGGGRTDNRRRLVPYVSNL